MSYLSQFMDAIHAVKASNEERLSKDKTPQRTKAGSNLAARQELLDLLFDCGQTFLKDERADQAAAEGRAPYSEQEIGILNSVRSQIFTKIDFDEVMINHGLLQSMLKKGEDMVVASFEGGAKIVMKISLPTRNAKTLHEETRREKSVMSPDEQHLANQGAEAVAARIPGATVRKSVPTLASTVWAMLIRDQVNVGNIEKGSILERKASSILREATHHGITGGEPAWPL